MGHVEEGGNTYGAMPPGPNTYGGSIDGTQAQINWTVNWSYPKSRKPNA